MKMHYILFYETVDNYVEKRAPYREEHLKLAQKASEQGNLIMGGAFADDSGGAALVFKGENSKIAEEFVRNDPYVKNGLIKRWYIRPWKVVVGDK